MEMDDIRHLNNNIYGCRLPDKCVASGSVEDKLEPRTSQRAWLFQRFDHRVGTMDVVSGSLRPLVHGSASMVSKYRHTVLLHSPQQVYFYFYFLFYFIFYFFLTSVVCQNIFFIFFLLPSSYIYIYIYFHQSSFFVSTLLSPGVVLPSWRSDMLLVYPYIGAGIHLGYITADKRVSSWTS